MRVLHFSTSDIAGGAAKAAFRLHGSLRAAGHSSRMIVRNRDSDDPDVHLTPYVRPSVLERARRRIPWPNYRLPKASYTFNFDAEPDVDFDAEPDVDTRCFYSHEVGAVDIICLHWISGFLSVKAIRALHAHYRCPIVWTLMDEEPLTGGCHYTFGCDGFTKQCGYCPQLTPRHAGDRSRIVWRRKRMGFQELPITLVAVTEWVASRARASSLFGNHRIERIPLAIDATTFRPFNKRVARELLHLPEEKHVILVGAYSMEDTRKGLAYLLEALQHLSVLTGRADSTVAHEDICLLVIGHDSAALEESVPFASYRLGYLRDEVSLALAYQAADVFVCPSIEDAGPMMIPESMLCGTPVVAFDSGGAPDLIETRSTGYLAAYKDTMDLARGVHFVLDGGKLPAMGVAARAVALTKHSPELVARRHAELYALLVEQPRA